MRVFGFVMLFAFGAISMGHRISHKSTGHLGKSLVDTLSILRLSGAIYGGEDCEVLRLCNLDADGYQIDATKRIEVYRAGNSIGVISIPPSEDVKNFSVTKLAASQKGFDLGINWGGGENIYDVDFYFEFRNGAFFLTRVSTSHYGAGKDVEKQEERLKVEIGRFRIEDYLH